MIYLRRHFWVVLLEMHLGTPVEFMSLKDIYDKYGANGMTEMEVDPVSKDALITDDTQMTLFTADGLIWAYERMRERGIGSYTASGVYHSYLRWYFTQTGILMKESILEKQPHEERGGLLDYESLFSQRAPGMTCLSALGSGRMGTIEDPINNSKGCGGVMRVAPVGLFLHNNPENAFRVGAELAAITHGHPSGYWAAGAFSMIIAELINGQNILEASVSVTNYLGKVKQGEETLLSLKHAIELAQSNLDPTEAIPKLGEGWVAEEALAIALYCALKETDYKKSLCMAVNHDGDSDSTGAICGNLLGAYKGLDGFPDDWGSKVELRNLIVNISSKLYDTQKHEFKNKND